MNDHALEGPGGLDIVGRSERVDQLRRSMLAAGALSFFIGAKERPAVGSTAGPFQVPSVDSVSVQVITDNATFGPFLDNLILPGLKVIRTGADHRAQRSMATILKAVARPADFRCRQRD